MVSAHRTPPRHTHGAWVALVAMLLHVMAPTWAGVTAARGSLDGWIEVCGADGPRRVAVDPGAQGPAGASHGAHCLLCVASGDAPALPASAGAQSLPAADGPFAPLAGDDRARDRRPLGTAAPRGPPARA